MTTPVFALTDCNNFYASCERVFNPKLLGKPVVVLSNNDGCAISRSNEAKAIGVPMGAPYFKFKHLCNIYNVSVLSSNYRLYGDMSNRVMSLLKQYFPAVEVYSIDEAFLRLDKLPTQDIVRYTEEAISGRVSSYTGIPLSVGIGTTKTLAKIANYIAKKNHLKIFDLRDEGVRNKILLQTDIKDVWGIGRGIKERLNRIGINTAYDLKEADPKLVRKVLGVIGEKIVLELRGISCLKLQELSDPKKSITTSRSFGAPLTSLEELEEALAHYCATACAKLRAAQRRAGALSVFITTNYHSKEQEFYNNSQSLYFDLATDDTMQVITAAKDCLKQLYRPGLRYKKVGVTLLGLVDNHYQQTSLLSCHVKAEKSSALMQTIDSINGRMGKGTISIAAEGIKRSWQMKSSWRSPNFTSSWDELILAR